MLQIKNTLGGGKPEGLYMWKKSSVACINSITTQTRKNYTLGNATSDTTVYYSTSYTLDETTGTYTLVNPKSATLQYAQWGIYSVEMVKSNYYIWGSTSSNEIYTTNASSTYNVHLKNADGSVFLESDSDNYKYDIHSAKIEYTFLDYVISDKETAYPDCTVHTDGYYYERVVDGIDLTSLGFTKWEIGEFTLASSSYNPTIKHSLGVVPKAILIRASSFPTSANRIHMYAALQADGGDYNAVFNYLNEYETTYAAGGAPSFYSDKIVCTAQSSYKFINATPYKYIILY